MQKQRWIGTLVFMVALVALTVGLTFSTLPLTVRAQGTEGTNAVAWDTDGNSVNNKSFLGTTNNKPLKFKTNNAEAMRISQNGNVGIGTTKPAVPLEIANGRLRLSSSLGDIQFTETADLIANALTPSPMATDPAFRVDTGTRLTRAFTLLNNGNVGIGDPNPAGRLIVKGDGQTFLLRVQTQAGADALKVVNNGVVSFGALYSLSSTNHLCYHAPANLVLTSCSSAAEYVPTIDSGTGFSETADLVSIAPSVMNPYGDTHGPFTVQKSTTACDTNLLGFIIKPESGADGVKLNDHYLPLAIYGYFPAKVTMENGTIKRGDPVTSSSKAGYGMKATGACKVIGYALEDATTEGTIQVLANLGENSASEVVILRGKVDALTQENLTLKQELAAIEARLAALEQTAPLTHIPSTQAYSLR